jgi:hypothetical protein
MAVYVWANVVQGGLSSPVAYSRLVTLRLYHYQKTYNTPYGQELRAGGRFPLNNTCLDYLYLFFACVKFSSMIITQMLIYRLFIKMPGMIDVIINSLAISFLDNLDREMVKLIRYKNDPNWVACHLTTNSNLKEIIDFWRQSPENERWLQYFEARSLSDKMRLVPTFIYERILQTLWTAACMYQLAMLAKCLPDSAQHDNSLGMF